MIAEEKIKLVSNYVEYNGLNNPKTLAIPVMETSTQNDDILMLENMRKKRDLSIDILLGERPESDLDLMHSWASDELETIGMLTQKVSNINLNISNLRTHEEVYKKIINFIDSATNTKKVIPGSQSNLDIKMTNDVDFRKILSRLSMCSNMINMLGRIGGDKTVLVGSDNWEYFSQIENRGMNMGLNFIYEGGIDTKKVIVLKSGKSGEPGIQVVKSDGNFYIGQTNFWLRQFCWFLIN